jgi:selenide,water dikinase
MAAFDIHAATDVTGFGLSGHGFEMAKASEVCLEIEIGRLPIMDEALAVYKKGMRTGVNAYNRQMVEKYMRIEADVPLWHQEIIFDPQTSGGLLVAVSKAQGENLIKTLVSAGVAAAKIIGRVREVKAATYLVFK